MLMQRFIIVGLFLVTNLLSAFTSEDYQRGVQAYDEEHYAAAEKIFTTALAEGVKNGSIYYNLGNIKFRQGQLGWAVAYLLAAREYLPRDADVSANLNFLHKQIKDSVSLQDHSLGSRLIFWKSWLSLRELFLLAVMLSLVLILLAFAALWGPIWIRQGVFGMLGITVFAWFAFSACSINHASWGAVAVPELSLRSGPGENNVVLTVLHEGAPLKVLRQEGGWFLVEWVTPADTSGNQKGWAFQAEIAVL